MSRKGNLNGLNYLKHKPGVQIRENTIRYWCDNLDDFQGWEMYVPDYYIEKIKNQAKKNNVKDRDPIQFDSKFLLSVSSSFLYKFQSYLKVLIMKSILKYSNRSLS